MFSLFTPYSTAVPFFAAGGGVLWAGDVDNQRIRAYNLYEQMYWGESKEGISVGGEDDDILSIPIGRSAVEAIHRFLAVGWNYTVVGGTPAENSACNFAFNTLFKREQLKSKVSSAKRFCLIRGDAMLHITADPFKKAGSRLSVSELDPASYFPIYDLEEPERILGCHIVDIDINADGEEVIRRLTYRKQFDEFGNPTGRITTETAVFEMAGWDDRFGAKPEDIKMVSIIVPETELPEEISQIPVYHWKNTRNSTDTFGSSIFRGLEKIFKAIDQAITDEDLSIALTSLGVYATDGGKPVDQDGNESDWVIGPGRVVEVAKGSSFTRVNGITSVQPVQDHVTYLESKARSGVGVPAVAAGDVDVNTAESGIALALRMLPLMAANAERELEMIGKLDQMLFDLQTMWFPAYEDINFGNVVVESSVEDPMPVNRDAVVAEVIQLLGSGLITMEMAISKLASIGWDYPDEAVKTLLEETATRAAVADPFATRTAAEEKVEDVPADETA